MEEKQSTLEFLLRLLVPGIIAGILAWIGAYFGAKWQGKAQKENLQLEIRSKIFNNFLETLEMCEKQRSADLTVDPELIFWPLKMLITPTKVYLDQDDKYSFEQLTLEYIRNTQWDIKYNYRGDWVPGFEGSAQRARKAKQKLEDIINHYLNP